MAEETSLEDGILDGGLDGGILDGDEEGDASEEGAQNEASENENSGEPAGEDAQTESGDGKAAETPAPEEWKLEAGEGSPVPAENLASFEKACKDAKLSREQAEALLSWHKSFGSGIAQAQAQQEARIIDGWKAELAQDAEFGGRAWRQTVADARRALNAFDEDGSLRQLLKNMRADYNPSVVRTIARVGRAMAEDKIITAGSGKAAPSKRPLEDRIWKD